MGSNLPSDAEERLARIDELRSHVRSCVYRHLEQAEHDICTIPVIFAPGDDPTPALGIGDFYSYAFQRAVLASTLRTSISMPPSKASDGTVLTNPKLDLLAMYSEYCQQLRSEAARRPRRRLFLNIAALLDELYLLSGLLDESLEEVNG